MALTSLPVRLGEVHPCPYLAGRKARLGWIDPRTPLSSTLYTALLQAGCRRSGEAVYRPFCPRCQDCIPVRIPVVDFSPDRSQRRAWRRNADLRVTWAEAELSDEHYDLYLRYQRVRHAGESMAAASREDVADFLTCSWMTSWFVELRRENRLVAVAVVDRAEDALSAVYTFYDPDDARTAPGIYTVLSLIHLARSFGLRWCYLGYWISDSRKMNYKDRFRPLEARLGEHWLRFGRGRAVKFPAGDVL